MCMCMCVLIWCKLLPFQVSVQLHTGLTIKIYVILINQFFPHCGIIVESKKKKKYIALTGKKFDSGANLRLELDRTDSLYRCKFLYSQSRGLILHSPLASRCMYPTLCDPMDSSLPGSSVHGIFQARILEWLAISFSRGSSPPRDQNCISSIGRKILYHWSTWEAHTTPRMSLFSEALADFLS